MKSIERERKRIVRAFIATNLVEDTVLGVANLLASAGGVVNNFAISLRYLKYDQARRYRDLTGGDFGEAMGRPGMFTGEEAALELERGEEDE